MKLIVLNLFHSPAAWALDFLNINGCLLYEGKTPLECMSNTLKVLIGGVKQKGECTDRISKVKFLVNEWTFCP